MKIAVLSDIHANPLALTEVLRDINEFNPDKIFILGDLILAGYNPNKTCQMIFELKDKYKDNFYIIQGNTDKMVSCCTAGLIEKTKEAFPCMGYSLEDDIKITDKKYLDYVKNLPEKLFLELNGLKIELVHGSPRNQSENIYPNLSEDEVIKMTENSDADLILCGHTHIPCGYSLKNNKTVVNVGSVGRSALDNKKSCYLRLVVDKDAKFYTEHRLISYDNIQASRHVQARGFKHCEDLVRMYLE